MQWGNIVANQALPDDWFSAPEFERTDIQRFIEQLYDQRGDLESVMWTYRNFRAAFPMVDTSEAVNMAGFQTLKMGVTDTAIALLSQNVMDNPDSATASFELGRAYHTDGNVPAAREEYTRTLALDPDHEQAQSALLMLPD
jgi:tetratricopeptide (TPR) repeat protein